MVPWLKVSTAAVVAVVSTAAGLHHQGVLWPRAEQQPQSADRHAAVVEPQLIHCRRAAQLHFDIAWASACMATDDNATDCTLPDERAAVLNAAYQRADDQCFAESGRKSAALFPHVVPQARQNIVSW